MALTKITHRVLLVICLLAVLSLAVVACGGEETTKYTEGQLLSRMPRPALKQAKMRYTRRNIRAAANGK